MPNDNTLQNYLNKNYVEAINSLEVIQGKARESGNIYYAIELKFINGYSKRIFLKNEEVFAWTNAFDTLDSQTDGGSFTSM